MASVDEFAQAVAKLERQLLRLPGEREIAEELMWSLSRQALIGLGQETKTAGLVRVFYEETSGHRRYGSSGSSEGV